MRLRTRLQIATTRICQNCGKPYSVGTPGSGYKYCCRACAKKAQWKQIERWNAANEISVNEWRNWYKMRKFQDKLAQYEEERC